MTKSYLTLTNEEQERYEDRADFLISHGYVEGYTRYDLAQKLYEKDQETVDNPSKIV